MDDEYRADARADAQHASWAAHNLPLDPEQSCAFCGSDDWQWVYPLNPSLGGRVTLPTFWCACGPCHDAVDHGRDVDLIQRHNPDCDKEPYPFAEVILPLFHASRARDPLARAAAQQQQ